MTLPTGYKTFLDDTVLPADDINGYLMQGILVFTDASDRDTSLVGNLREGQYAYLQSDKTTYVYSGTAWQRVGKQDVETVKNFQSFTASGGTSVPDWATKMYYLIVRGGNAGGNGGGGQGTPGGAGGAGGQVLQGDVAVTGGTSLTITVGGAAANSSVAISGGSTFTASSTGATGGAGGGISGGNGADGAALTGVFAGLRFGGGGGGGSNADTNATMGSAGRYGGGDGGRNGAMGASGGTGSPGPGRPGFTNSGGGGGGGAGSGGGGTGGSGIVLLYFS
jgi:hypothetical protein